MGLIKQLKTAGCHLMPTCKYCTPGWPSDVFPPFCDDTLCYTTGTWWLGNTLLETSFSAFSHLFSSRRHDGWHEPYDEPDDVHADAADGCFNVEHVNELSIQQCILFMALPHDIMLLCPSKNWAASNVEALRKTVMAETDYPPKSRINLIAEQTEPFMDFAVCFPVPGFNTV